MTTMHICICIKTKRDSLFTIRDNKKCKTSYNSRYSLDLWPSERIVGKIVFQLNVVSFTQPSLCPSFSHALSFSHIHIHTHTTTYTQTHSSPFSDPINFYCRRYTRTHDRPLPSAFNLAVRRWIACQLVADGQPNSERSEHHKCLVN